MCQVLYSQTKEKMKKNWVRERGEVGGRGCMLASGLFCLF